MQKITPCLWFDTKAEEAANFYVSLFDDSAVTRVDRDLDGTPSGDNVALVFFRLAGQEYMAINGGPQFPFIPRSCSFSVELQGPGRGRPPVVDAHRRRWRARASAVG